MEKTKDEGQLGNIHLAIITSYMFLYRFLGMSSRLNPLLIIQHLHDVLREARGSPDGPFISVNLSSLKVDVETTTDVPPNDDIGDI